MPEVVLTIISIAAAGSALGLAGAALVAFTVIVSAITIHAQRAARRKGQQALDLDEVRTFGGDGNPSVQEFFGTAWVGAKVFYSDNTRRVSGGGYQLISALCQHEVESVLDMRVNGESMLDSGELDTLSNNGLVQLRDEYGDPLRVIGDTSHPFDFRGNITAPLLNRITNKDELDAKGISAALPGQQGAAMLYLANKTKADGFRPQVRKDADERAADASWSFNMEIVPHLTQRRNLTLDPTNPFSNLFAFFIGLQPLYLQEVLDKYRALNSYGSTHWSPPEGFESWTEAGFRANGTACMCFFMPVVTDETKQAIWSPPPNIELLLHRNKNTLNLWDPAITGNPPIDPDWSDANAALCAFHYANTYTPYKDEIGGEPGIDLNSVYQAALYCHEHNLECNGGFHLNQSPQDMFGHLEAAMGGGAMMDKGGVLYIHAGSYTNPVQTYTYDDMVRKSIRIQPFPERSLRKAVTEVAYIGYDNTEHEALFTNNLARDAGENLNKDSFQSAFINNHSQAARIAYITNAHAWNAAGFQFTLRSGIVAPEPWDIVRVVYDEAGIDATIRVNDVKLNLQNNETTIMGSSVDSRWYDDPAGADVLPAPIPLTGAGRSDTVDLLLLDDGCHLLIDANNPSSRLRIN